MIKTVILLISMLLLSTLAIAEDVVLVAVKVKIDAYSAKDMRYLGVFANLNKILKPTCMVKSKNGKLIVAGSPASFNEANIIVSINPDGSFDKVIFKNDTNNSPISTPASIVELDDGSFVIYDIGKKKLFKISQSGEFLGEFLKPDAERPDSRRITSVFKYGTDLVVMSSDPDYKLVEYDQEGNLVTNLTTGNEYIQTPMHVSEISNGYIMVALAQVEVEKEDGERIKLNKTTLIQLDKDLLFIKKLIDDNEIISESLIRPTLAIKNKITGEFIIIDEGRNRGTTRSYDDNLELFSSDGKYQKSLGTYEDTLLRSILWFEGSTKKW